MSKNDYDSFAEYIEAYISPADIIALKNKYKKATSEEEMKEELRKFFIKKWDENADPKPRTGNANTQRKNFEKFVDKEIVSLKKDHFRDLTEPIKKASSDYIPDRKVSDRVKRALIDLNPPSNKQELIEEITKVKPGELSKYDEKELAKKSTYSLLQIWQAEKGITNNEQTRINRYEQLNRMIEKAESSGNYKSMLLLYEEINKNNNNPKPLRTLNSYQANSLLNKMQPFLNRYGEEKPLSTRKTEDEIIEALNMKGISSEGLSGRRLIDEAKKSGIGLLRADLNRDELKNKILNKSWQRYSSEDLDNKSEYELNRIWTSVRFIKPKEKTLFTDLDDLPSDKKIVNEYYERGGTKLKLSELTKAKERIKTSIPIFDNKELEERAYKRVLAKKTSNPVFDIEVERRYAEWYKGNPEAELDWFDRKELSKMNQTLASGTILRFGEEKLPKKQWVAYQQSLKDQIKREEDMLTVKKNITSIKISEQPITTIQKKY